MAKITRIKAKDDARGNEKSDEPVITRKKIVANDKKSSKNRTKDLKRAEKKIGEVQSGKKPFILVRPFVYFGRYLKESWQELRQVRWPNRKATWKMVLAVIIYTAIFMAFIFLLDLFFSFIFNLILRKG